MSDQHSLEVSSENDLIKLKKSNRSKTNNDQASEGETKKSSKKSKSEAASQKFSEDKPKKKKSKKEASSDGSDEAESKPKKRKIKEAQAEESSSDQNESETAAELLEPAPKKKKLNKENDKKKSKEETSDSVEKQSSAESEEEEQIPKELQLDTHDLTPSTKQALINSGRTSLFPIQAACLAKVMAGKDLLGRARTGTGKTLAFVLPIVETLKRDKATRRFAYTKRGRPPAALIMAPTRELANQVFKEFETIASGELQMVCVYGGAPYDTQNRAFSNGMDIVVGTPGRLIDHVERGTLKLHSLKFICLDEADQMLDIGFAESMEKILQQTSEQKKNHAHQDEIPQLQTLLFSATIPEWVNGVLSKYMRPTRETVDLVGTQKLKTSENVKHLCLPSRWQNRAAVLGDIVTVYGTSTISGGKGATNRTIIFVETKGEANDLGLEPKLVALGVQVLHGDVQQKQREQAIQGFRDGKFRCLVTTNVCARGVDIPEVDLVINCEPPNDVETYIHRSGRTGRAGKKGVCVTFYKPNQQYLLQNISRRAGVQFKHVAAPQPKDILQAKSSSALVSLTATAPSLLPYFHSSAEALLAACHNDPIAAISACLAAVTHTTKPPPSRSLLTAQDGFVSCLFYVQTKSGTEFRGSGLVRAALQRGHPGLTYEDTAGWKVTKDRLGCVVDIKEEKVSFDEDGSVSIAGVKWTSRDIEVRVCSGLPDLAEADSGQGYGNNGGWSRGGGGGGGGNQRSYGGGNRNNGGGGGGGYRGGRFSGNKGGSGGRGGSGGARPYHRPNR